MKIKNINGIFGGLLIIISIFPFCAESSDGVVCGTWISIVPGFIMFVVGFLLICSDQIRSVKRKIKKYLLMIASFEVIIIESIILIFVSGPWSNSISFMFYIIPLVWGFMGVVLSILNKY